MQQIILKHRGHIDIYKRRKYANIMFDLIKGNYNLNPQGIQKVKDLFNKYLILGAKANPKYSASRPYMTFGSPVSGSVFKLLIEYADTVATKLQKILEDEENLVRIEGAIDES